MPTTDDENKKDDLNYELRKALNDAYGFVEGQKSVQTFSAITFEDLLDAQIERLVGKDTESRPNAYNKITKIEQNAIQTIAKVKSLPDDAFLPAKEKQDVNTSVEPPEE